MHRVQITDRTKEKKTATYYMEDAAKLLELWKENEESEERIERMRQDLLVTEVELKVGAKQDFTLEKSCLTLHNTKGYESTYYVASLLVKIRWAVCEGSFLKLGAFVATGICKENSYGDGGFEQVTCYGNPVLKHYSSSIVPQVSDFEDEFNREKITMLGYKVLDTFATLKEVNEDIEKKELSTEEIETLLHNIPGELG